MNHFVQHLNREFDERKARNSSYSLRSFARTLQISPASLSLYMRSISEIPLRTAEKLGMLLGLSPGDVRKFYLKPELKNAAALKGSRELSTDEFRVISDPLHFAILGIAQLSVNSSDKRWLAKMLAVSEQEASDGYERLRKLGIVQDVGTGFRQTTKPLLTTQDVPDIAIRNYHRRVLRMAESKLDVVPIAMREYSASTFAISVQSISKAKAAIRKFREELQGLTKGKYSSQVYSLAIQFFPVSKSIKEEQ